MSESSEKTTRNLAKKTHEMLMGLSRKDQMTQLLNRRGVVSMTEQVLNNLKRENLSPYLTVTILDMIGLKALNLKYSEPVVDQKIKESVQKMQNSVRESDIVGRLREGGDEFLVMSFDTDSEGTKKMIDKLRSSQPDEFYFNTVFKRFYGKIDVNEAIDEVLGKLDSIKRGLQHDSTGRVVGFGVTVELS